ncbi:HesA/MoeB/ThiF family protein [Abyssicoccus albus]|uniref:HesA/MoeB/ThiF family protein n=1 Tax=Abyssicoccus albus TaxID=1817405 RepID=UPI00097E2D20|nr:HesA/MoeB/ThiF family protein [Abyssicoccus albus]AQL56878.1 hypothetical protein BVH56_08100 [Abyssicoccus albus]
MNSRRYDRQMRVKEFTSEGQQLINQQTVLIVGCGALGTHLADALVRIGIHHAILVDFDIVSMSNLHRQILFDEMDVEKSIPKALAAKQKLENTNSEVKVTARVDIVTLELLEELYEQYQFNIIFDGTDNIETRKMISAFSTHYEVPWVFGGVIGTDYQVALFDPSHTIDFLSIYDTLPTVGDSCQIEGVMISTVSMCAHTQLMKYKKWLIHSEYRQPMTIGNVFDMTILNIPLSEPDAKSVKIELSHYRKSATQFIDQCGRDTMSFNHSYSLEDIQRRLIALELNIKTINEIISTKYDGHRILFTKDTCFIHDIDHKEIVYKIKHELFG